MYPLYSNIIVVMQVIFIWYQVVMRIMFFHSNIIICDH
jgi:hypothetical protein